MHDQSTDNSLSFFVFRAGFFPAGQILSRCLSTGKWSTEAPACDTCREGFYRDAAQCLQCEQTACLIGQYRTACIDNAGSTCVPCKNPATTNFKFIEAGNPAHVDNCKWVCSIGYFKDTDSCRSCTTSQCLPGQYREKCTTEGVAEDARCLPCNSALLPTGASWTSSDNCDWKCDRGFERNASTCIPSAKPTIKVADPSLSKLNEAESNTSTEVLISLSEKPTSEVTITVTVSNQLSIVPGLPSNGRIVFTPENWNVPQKISVLPVDDLDREGDHSGSISFSVDSSDVLYKNLDTPPVSVNIEDNDCLTLTAPANGELKGLQGAKQTEDCIRTYGNSCEIQCNNGFDPITPVKLTCLTTGLWDRSIPTCTACADGFYRQSSQCTKCSTEVCTTIGQFRAACPGDSSQDSVCISCTNSKPSNSHYTTAGNPYNENNCQWACDTNYYRSGDSCLPCTTSTCPVGKYLATACSSNADRICSPCSNKLPSNATFTTSGNSSGLCSWTCNENFALSDDSKSCVALPARALIVTPVRMHTQEDSGALPAEFQLSLSRAPAGDVVATITQQAQMQGCTPSKITFTATSYGPVTVKCAAVVDSVQEGLHKGTVLVSLQSTQDGDYNNLPQKTIRFDIEEVKCLERSDGSNYKVVDCNTAVGGECRLQCNTGFSPEAPVTLTCVKDSSGVPRWSGTVPSCNECVSGYFSKSSPAGCFPCETADCPAGEYRSACKAEAGAACVDCTTKPPNSRYTSAGTPFNSDACKWQCNEGYILYAATSSCLMDTAPQVTFSESQPRCSEEPGTPPATVSVKLSHAPIVPVKIQVSWESSQLGPPSTTGGQGQGTLTIRRINALRSNRGVGSEDSSLSTIGAPRLLQTAAVRSSVSPYEMVSSAEKRPVAVRPFRIRHQRV